MYPTKFTVSEAWSDWQRRMSAFTPEERARATAVLIKLMRAREAARLKRGLEK